MNNYNNSSDYDFKADESEVLDKISKLEKVLRIMSQNRLAYCPDWIKARRQLNELKTKLGGDGSYES